MGHLASHRLPLSLLAAALLAPGAARANGFALDIQGLFSNGTATAGAASAHDPAGQLGNPAILVSLEGTQVVVGGMVIAPSAPYTDGGTTLAAAGGAPLAGTNQDGGQTGAAPWVFASHRLSPGLAVGFSFYAPFGLKTDFGKDSRFFGRYQGVESVIESVAFGPSVAWRPVDAVAIGASVAARRDRAVIGQAFDLGSICYGAPGAGPAACDPMGYTPGNSDGYGRFSATGWGWTGTLGAIVEPAKGTLVGVAYRREAQSKVKGKETFDQRTRDFLAAIPAWTASGDPAASLDLPLPDFLTVSLSQRLGAVELLAALQYTLWDRFDLLKLRPDDAANGLPIDSKQGFRNALRVSGAAAWTVRPGLDLFGGVAFEQSPVTTKYRQATLPERDSLIAGLGTELAVYRGLSVGACYQRVQMIGSSRIEQTGATGDALVGKVKGSANVGVLQLAWRG